MPATLVIHRRVADGSNPAYAEWQHRVGDALASWPGFLDRWVLPPTPPGQVDWIAAQRFSTDDAARSWLHSAEREALILEATTMFVGNDDVQIYTSDQEHRSESVSAVIATRLPPEREVAFLEWQHEVMAAESRFEGFRGHRLEGPTPGVRDDWVMQLSFDTEEHLSAWLQSDERQELLAEGAAFNENMSVTRPAVGFGVLGSGSAYEGSGVQEQPARAAHAVSARLPLGILRERAALSTVMVFRSGCCCSSATAEHAAARPWSSCVGVLS